MNDELFLTLMTEAEAVVNGRPLTVDNLSDPLSPCPLIPNHLLTMKSNTVLPPAGVFEKPDLYCRRRWRRVQHIADEFWNRWKKEYLASLQPRQKNVVVTRNFKRLSNSTNTLPRCTTFSYYSKITALEKRTKDVID